MKEIQGNILDVAFGVICHQVNCFGVMGAGVALQIKKKWPRVFELYKRAHEIKLLKLGEVIIIKASPAITVANLVAQYNYGRKTGVCYTNYDALRKCLEKLEYHTKAKPPAVTPPIYFPKGMGCGLAGGDWNVVSRMIEEIITEPTIVEYKF